MKNILILVVAMAVVTACQPSKLSEAEMRKILHDQNEKLADAFKSGDAEKIALMYDEHAKLCGNGENEIYVGRDAIKKFWDQAMKGFLLVDMTTETITVDGNADLIYETGKVNNKILVNDSAIVSTAKFVNVWKKQDDGSYKLDIDTWNSVGSSPNAGE